MGHLRLTIGVVLAMFIATVCLVACGGGGGGGGGGGTNGKTKLRWLTDNNPLRQQQVDLFESLHPDIEIELDVSQHDLSKILTQVAAGAGPDLTDIENMGSLQTLARRGALIDLTERVEASDAIDLGRYFEPAEGWSKVDGKVYSLPHGCISLSMICNVTMFEEAGIPLPSPDWTWDDFREVAVALTKKDERGRYSQFGWSGYLDWAWFHWLWQNGADVFNEDGTACVLNTPEAKETVQFIYDMREKYRASPNDADLAAMSGGGGWGSGGINLMSVNKVAMVERGRDVLIAFRDLPDVKWMCVPLPRRKTTASTFVSRPVGITRDCKNVDAAFKFLEFVHSDVYHKQIIELADGQPSRRDICETDAFLKDPAHPGEHAANAVFLAQMDVAQNPALSPYIAFPKMNRIMEDAFDRMWAGLSTPDETCELMTEQINAEIRKNLASGG